MSARQIADRKREFAFFEAMLTGACTERIFLISAPSESGKTVLLSELARFAAQLLGTGKCARLNLKGEQPLNAVLDRLCVELGQANFPKYCACGVAAPVKIHADLRQAQFGNENAVTVAPHIHAAVSPSPAVFASSMIADLSAWVTPAVAIIDTFEQATEETGKWIVQQLLPLTRHLSNFCVVIAGQKVPQPADYLLEWGDLAKPHALPLVTSTDDWHEYACQRYPGFPREHIEVVCRGLASRPSAIQQFIDGFGSQLGDGSAEALS